MLSIDYERSHAELVDLAASDEKLALAAREYCDLLTTLCPEAAATLSGAAGFGTVAGRESKPHCSLSPLADDIRPSRPNPAAEHPLVALLAYERYGVSLSGTTPVERREALADLLGMARSALDRLQDTPPLKPLCVIIQAALVRWAIDHRSIVEVDGLACALRIDPPSLSNAIRNGYLSARDGLIDCTEALRWLDGAGGYQRSTWQKPDDPSDGSPTRHSLVADAALARLAASGQAVRKA